MLKRICNSHRDADGDVSPISERIGLIWECEDVGRLGQVHEALVQVDNLVLVDERDRELPNTVSPLCNQTGIDQAGDVLVRYVAWDLDIGIEQDFDDQVVGISQGGRAYCERLR